MGDQQHIDVTNFSIVGGDISCPHIPCTECVTEKQKYNTMASSDPEQLCA